MGCWFSEHQILVSGMVAALIGHVAWNGYSSTFPLSVGLLFLLLLQTSRWAAYAVALAYYAASTWPLVPGARAFFGASSQSWKGVGLWTAASIVLASPWAIFHFNTWPAKFCSTLLAISSTCLPPLGLIGWASPLTGAGMLFPGTGWLGILALLFLPAVIIRRPRFGLPLAAALVALANSVYPGAPPPPWNWEAVDTAFGRSEIELPDPIREFKNANWIQQRALNSTATVVLFPETVVPRWNDATESFWGSNLETLSENGKTIVLGTTTPVAGTSLRFNTVIVRGAGMQASYIQRIPVPISMWKPFSHSGFPLRLSSPGTINIAAQRAGVLICYELLLTWPVLSLSLEHPTILVGVANDYWATQTSIPVVQRITLNAWARLFGLPKLMAVNI